jgi:hypothetical protein
MDMEGGAAAPSGTHRATWTQRGIHEIESFVPDDRSLALDVNPRVYESCGTNPNPATSCFISDIRHLCTACGTARLATGSALSQQLRERRQPTRLAGEGSKKRWRAPRREPC